MRQLSSLVNKRQFHKLTNRNNHFSLNDVNHNIHSMEETKEQLDDGIKLLKARKNSEAISDVAKKFYGNRKSDRDKAIDFVENISRLSIPKFNVINLLMSVDDKTANTVSRELQASLRNTSTAGNNMRPSERVARSARSASNSNTAKRDTSAVQRPTSNTTRTSNRNTRTANSNVNNANRNIE